jgi:hypothetical protein
MRISPSLLPKLNDTSSGTHHLRRPYHHLRDPVRMRTLLFLSGVLSGCVVVAEACYVWTVAGLVRLHHTMSC